MHQFVKCMLYVVQRVRRGRSVRRVKVEEVVRARRGLGGGGGKGFPTIYERLRWACLRDLCWYFRIVFAPRMSHALFGQSDLFAVVSKKILCIFRGEISK